MWIDPATLRLSDLLCVHYQPFVYYGKTRMLHRSIKALILTTDLLSNAILIA